MFRTVESQYTTDLVFHKFTYINKQHRINQAIRAVQVRLIDENEEFLGIKPIGEALSLAAEKETDLVEVAPLANPPVCKLMDYGKYLYRQKKNEQKQKASQKKVELKVIRLSVRIDEHDLEVKIKKAEKFIKERNSVKVTLLLRGREAAMRDLAIKKMENFKSRLSEVASVEAPPRFQGNAINMILIPQR